MLAIQGCRLGVGIARLVEETGLARATVYRYLKLLTDAGVPLHADTVNGEKRYRLLRAAELPPLGLSALSIAALHLARLELQPVAGAQLVCELEALLEKLRPSEAQQRFLVAKRRTGHPQILKTVEEAMHYGRRARIAYRAASRNGALATFDIEPLLFTVADGQPYVHAYCVERAAERTYKLARIAHVELTDQPATHRPPRPPAEAFAHSVKVWASEAVHVSVRLDASVAWLAPEYPLVPNQTLQAGADGSVIVRAQVAGLTETKRWVLAWGGAAEALHPPELRAATRSELAQALQKYDGPGPAKASPRPKSTARSTRRLTNGETRRG